MTYIHIILGIKDYLILILYEYLYWNIFI
jgi:hypothetical protein